MKKTFPKLFQQSSTNKTKVWEIWVTQANDSSEATIHTNHGYIDGKIQTDLETIKTGLNLGKSNETTPYTQACNEAQSKWNKKKDKGYTEEGKKVDTNVLLPMLAEKFSERSHDIVYPAYAQPKLNGIRCIVHSDLRYQSRLGKFWDTITHLNKDIAKIQDKNNPPLDGEVYIHELNLQDIGALIKKKREENEVEGYNTEDLEYWIYDQVHPSDVFEVRNAKLEDSFLIAGAERYIIKGLKTFAWKLGNIVYVPTIKVNSKTELEDFKRQCIAAGFEGAMVRNNVAYVVGHRTKHLQKLKDFQDKEYKITGGYSGVGRDADCCTFTLITEAGIPFNCRPIGTVQQRKKYLKDIKSLIHKYATIRYQELTKDNVPFHGRVLAIRDYE